MATTKKAADPAKEKAKLLTTAIKKTVAFNSALPILEDVWLNGKHMIATDLETAVIVPFKAPGVNVCVPATSFIKFLEMMPSLSIKADKNFGVTVSQGSRTSKVMGENPDNFPRISMYNSVEKERGEQPYLKIGHLSEETMESLEIALSFVSNDDLRPAMTGVYFEEKQYDGKSWIVATDAHRLFWKPIHELAESFILPAKTAKILLALGGEWDIEGNQYAEMKDGKIIVKQPTKKVKEFPAHFIEEDVAYKGSREDAEYRFNEYFKSKYDSFAEYCADKHHIIDLTDEDEKETVEVPDTDKSPEPVIHKSTYIKFIRKDGVMVISRVIDGLFPNYRVVIPEGDGWVNLTADKKLLLEELKNAAFFANKSTHQVTLGMNGVFSIHSQDVDFSNEYHNEFKNGEGFEFIFSPDMPKRYRRKDTGNEVEIKEDLGPIVKLTPEYSYKEPEVIERDKLEEISNELLIAFNEKFITEIAHKHTGEEQIKFKMWTSTKAAIINDHFLVMPLMLNQ